MAKSPADRIKESFEGDDRDNIAKYVEWTRSTVMEYAQALRRSATITVIAVAIFEIITDSKNQTIQVASFTVARNSCRLRLPPLVCCLLFFPDNCRSKQSFPSVRPV